MPASRASHARSGHVSLAGARGPLAQGHSELMAQHQDLGVLPPLLPVRQPEQRHDTGYGQEDQPQAHEPKIIPRRDGPRPVRPALARDRARQCICPGGAGCRHPQVKHGGEVGAGDAMLVALTILVALVPLIGIDAAMDQRESPRGISSAASPQTLLAQDRKAAIVYGARAGILSGALAGTIAGIKFGATTGVLFGAGYGGLVGVMWTLTGAWGAYEITRIWLALRHQLPWPLMSFLADAHRRVFYGRSARSTSSGTSNYSAGSPTDGDKPKRAMASYPHAAATLLELGPHPCRASPQTSAASRPAASASKVGSPGRSRRAATAAARRRSGPATWRDAPLSAHIAPGQPTAPD
jgi:hypothetical protein